MKLVASYLRPYSGRVVLLLALHVVGTMTSLVLPAINAAVVDEGIAEGQPDLIIRLGGVMLLISVFQVACSFTAVYLSSRVATAMAHDLRRDLFASTQSFSAAELTQFGAPTLITRSTNDVQQVQMVTLSVFNIMVMSPIMLVGGIIMAVREDLRLSGLMIVTAPILGVCVGLILWKMVPHFKQMQQRLDTVNTVLREQVVGLRVVRAFTQERREAERFEEANQRLYDTSLSAGKLMALNAPTVLFIMSLSQVAIVWFGGLAVDAGDLQVGSLIAFLSYIMFILMAVTMATGLFMMIPRAAVAAGRIDEVLRTTSSVKNPSAPHPTWNRQPRRGRLEFSDVQLSRPGAESPVLSGITFSVEPGTTTAVIGSTGAGKTTLLSLIPRLYDVTAGSITFDGVDLRDIPAQDLRSHIGLVPQKAFLFSGTIASNLRYGKPEATDEELWSALEAAQAADFVRSLSGGLNATVAQGGATFSGGQRQRLAIARALVRQPLVYLFDDSFSALDATTDALLRSALKSWTRHSSVLLVAQRITAVRDCDQIVVLDNGVIAGRGTHQELLETNRVYQEIVTSQAPAEESLG
ncbi:ABC transporter ATP-binding protein [Nesterenkonia rhizosphaerae]|uniref:ABC transporter ATP-binding protein n=1 Tax=Nesterenkonia rhizosphaerae TaxID=1348272 RepID=A0ABP9FU66_9MICC